MLESFFSGFKIFKDKKKLSAVIILLSVGIMLVAVSGVSEESGGKQEISLAEYKAELEDELENMCSAIKGVGKCRVMLTFERGEENTYKGSSLVESKPPRVLGVSVVCRGADSPEIKRALVDMLSALFDIGTNRISVLKLNS